MQNQIDRIHLVTEYYPEGNLCDLMMDKVTFEEHEVQQIVKGLLSIIWYCHSELGIVLSNLNPESVAYQSINDTYHVRLINFSHHFKGSQIFLSDRQLKDRLNRVTGLGDYDCATFPALFMAPEQINFGLYLYKSELDDRHVLGSDKGSSASGNPSASEKENGE